MQNHKFDENLSTSNYDKKNTFSETMLPKLPYKVGISYTLVFIYIYINLYTYTHKGGICANEYFDLKSATSRPHS